MVKNQKNKINLVTWNSINKCILMNKKINNILGQKKKKLTFLWDGTYYSTSLIYFFSYTQIISGKYSRSESSPFKKLAVRRPPFKTLSTPSPCSFQPRRSPSFVCFNHNSRTEQLQCSPSRSPLETWQWQWKRRERIIT
jgi:hypothetical protein